jgi:hypothetical protein
VNYCSTALKSDRRLMVYIARWRHIQGISKKSADPVARSLGTEDKVWSCRDVNTCRTFTTRLTTIATRRIGAVRRTTSCSIKRPSETTVSTPIS